MARLGDHKWTHLLTAHNSAIRTELEAFGGKEVNTTGDGFVTTFEGPARAIKCAAAIRIDLHQLAMQVRAGIHCGECEIVDGALSGLAFNITARIADLADEGEILVSRTVRDLVAGSGLKFEHRGLHTLKGVP